MMFTFTHTASALAMLSAPLVMASPVPFLPVITASHFTDSFGISGLSVYEPTSESNGFSTLNFTVSAGNVTSTCGGQWSSVRGYPSGNYISCYNGTFGWNFERGSFASSSQFTLGIRQSTQDDSIGKAPYNFLTEFAKVSITSEDLTCSTEDSGRMCEQGDNKITANVYQTIAK